MAGNAKTNKFLLASATVMIGPMADLFKLNKDAHSVGLVKNFTFGTEPTFLDLTQGVTNDIVASAKTGNGATATWEMYEYTLRNLAYASGLDATSTTFDQASSTVALTNAITAAAATTITLAGDHTSIFPVGALGYIQKSDDYIHVFKVLTSAFATATTTITVSAQYAIPTGMSFPVGSKVGVLKAIDIGGYDLQANLAAKVVGILPQDGKPVVLMFPKVRITTGMNLSFATDNWSNMPFGFTPYVSTSEDPFYAEFGDRVARLFAG